MQGVAYPTKKPVSSNWEQMCRLVKQTQHVHPDGYWPTEFERIAEHESQSERLVSCHDQHNLYFVSETSTKEVLITDVETGEQCWVETKQETNPYSVGLDTEIDKISEQWIKIKTALSNAQTPIEVHDIVNEVIMAAAPSVQKMVMDQSLIKAAYEQVDEGQYRTIKSALVNTQTMRFINDLVEHLETKLKRGECSEKMLNRIHDDHLVIEAIKRINALNKSVAA